MKPTSRDYDENYMKQALESPGLYNMFFKYLNSLSVTWGLIVSCELSLKYLFLDFLI